MIKLSGISLRIWAPFALSITLFILAAGFYYPQKQTNIFYQNSNSKIKELSKTVALGVELALSADNFEGLKKTIELATSSSEFEFISIVEQQGGTESVFLVNPDTFDKSVTLKKDLSRFLYESYPIDSEVLKGYVLIAVSKKYIKDKVYALNFPVYVFLSSLLLVSLIVFLFLADSISKPIRYLKGVANNLEQEIYDISIEKMDGVDEVSELNNAFLSLRNTLKKAKIRNEEFNKELEDKIQIRTRDLEAAKNQLERAQMTSKIGGFEFHVESQKWLNSSDLFPLLNLDKNGENLDWLSFFDTQTQKDIYAFLEDSIDSNKKVIQKDFRLSYTNPDKKEIWVTLVAEFRFDLQGYTRSIFGTIQDITQRKLYEQEINRLSLVATKTSNSVIITDANKKIVWVNDALLNLTGYSRDEVIGSTPKMFQFAKTSQETINHIRENMIAKKEINTEILNVGKYGNEYWLDLNIVPLFDKNNIHNGYIAVENDITERKQFEQEILNIKNRLESILNEISDVVWSADIDSFETIFITPSGEKLYGFKNKEWISNPDLWKDLIVEEDRKIIDEILIQLNKNGAFDVNYRIKTPDDIIKWVHNRGRVIKNNDGSLLRIDGMISDITQVKQSIERQKQFIKEAPSAIAMLDKNFRYVAYSDKWVGDYELNNKLILGYSHFDIFPDLEPKWKGILVKCLEGGTFAHDEVKFTLNEQRHMWLKWRIKPWYSNVNTIGGLIMMTEDVTRFKESKEEELRNILKLTQSQNQRLKNFAHIVSHNLRSHSGNIQSLLSLMLEDYPQIMQDEIPVMLFDSSSNLTETIAHLSEVAAMNFNEKVQFTQLNLAEVVENAIKNVTALALDAQVEIINEIDPNIFMDGLAAYFDSIFLNFLTNGIKYSSTERDSFVKISSEDKGGFLCIKIEDNGIGIDLRRHGAKLFGMYKTFHKNEDARGIGLFITKNQIEAMGGRVEASSEINKGTVFSVLLKKPSQT